MPVKYGVNGLGVLQWHSYKVVGVLFLVLAEALNVMKG